MNLRKLDLNLLLVFSTVYETRSNTRAAERLGLTQSAVSNALKRLRAHLDDPLFERKGTEFLPTNQARKLAPEIKSALEAIERTLHGGESFDPKVSQRTFSLIAMAPIETLLIPHLSRLIIDNDYAISLNCLQYVGQEVEKAMEQGQIDVHFEPHASTRTDWNSVPLYDEQIVFVCRKGNPRYGSQSSISVHELANAPLVSVPENLRRLTHLEQAVREQNVDRRHVCIVSRLGSIPPVVAQSDMIGPLPEYMARYMAEVYGLHVMDLEFDRPPHQWHMVWPRQMEDDPGHKWFRQQIQTFYEQY
ncbi:MAG: LysR family transcriptional regulator [Pelagimonas sp.]|jgi:DNA-binding transcriptional LysR family regulator|nr:LysR family transcriptional regulator [Pelagimonas sp.]